jgi:hypothetical protein
VAFGYWRRISIFLMSRRCCMACRRLSPLADLSCHPHLSESVLTSKGGPAGLTGPLQTPTPASRFACQTASWPPFQGGSWDAAVRRQRHPGGCKRRRTKSVAGPPGPTIACASCRCKGALPRSCEPVARLCLESASLR